MEVDSPIQIYSLKVIEPFFSIILWGNYFQFEETSCYKD